MYKPKTKDELKKLVDNLKINLGDIDTSEITDMSYLFAFSKRSDFSGIENWDVSKVTNMVSMLSTRYFDEDISKWDVSNFENMKKCFLTLNLMEI